MKHLPIFRQWIALAAFGCLTSALPAANPIITDKFTADPAALVHNGTVYLYVGHDESPEVNPHYVMNEWLCYSSTDMVHWESQGSPLSPKSFAWAASDAWAGHVIERNGKFYFYAPMKHSTIHGFAIGVAVSDSPTGPFKDARGTALVTNDMTKVAKNSWDDIDPAAYIDDDGQAWLFWGNTACYYAKLKPNMTELDGPIQTADLPCYTEAPWVHKRKGLYYLSYATGFPEKTAYATAEKITGPWTPRGLLTELAGNCNTNHQAIIEFKNQWYYIYHNGGIQPSGGSFRRSVCVDRLEYNPDGTMKRVAQTTEGVSAVSATR